MNARFADLAPRMATVFGSPLAEASATRPVLLHIGETPLRIKHLTTPRASEWTVTPGPRETAKKKLRTGQPEDLTPQGTGTSASRASPGPSWTPARRRP